MQQSKNTSSRRSFVKKIAAGAALLGTSGPAILYGKNEAEQVALSRQNRFSANDNIQIALIGAGGMGVEDTKTALQVPGTKLVAVCDLYTGRLGEAKERWGKDLFTTKDYREILDRQDVDAVIIATPDHWHKQISVDALMKGKGAYCEKPMVQNVAEGPAVVQAQQKSGKTYQVGSQGLSSLGNEKAKELYESGAIGQLIYAEGFWARNSPTGAWQYAIPADASPETVDWDRYIANTTKRSFDPLRFFRWRNYRDYGTGVSGDLFVHLFSSLHFVTSSMGPNKVMATGGLRYWKDGREVPDVLLGMFDYPETKAHPAFNLSLRVNFVDGTSGSTYLRMVGSEGAMDVTWDDVFLRKNLTSDPMDAFMSAKSNEFDKALGARKKMLPPKEVHYKVEEGYLGAHYDHFTHFLEGVRNGKPVVEDAVFGYRAAAPALLCNDSYFEEKTVRWDPVAMKKM
ncbi:MAG: gfo/Idh/MocA family oxidoreductase [Haliscomenobacteraceae bacterium CHB4]|nr:Inositol 2-dehydrogenase/D-chiro-inositol 3-dehydrogenase [Saprospiraceae bacterium]MCE7921453.1 gfo/Idh/MocA family oxidoreductase [Haliscomenobacteraceae bacterium CHB4]